MNDYQPERDYASFLKSKAFLAPSAGCIVEYSDLHSGLKPFQRDAVKVALERGRFGLFLGTGLGKTFAQLEWARLAADRTIILAPLAVGQQTEQEARRWGITATYCRSAAASPTTGITIINPEMLDHFEPSAYGAVVLDESSCLKNYSGVLKRQIIDAFRNTPMRLSCSATPAPNDMEELCNQADFLGLMTPAEMRATFFTTPGKNSAHTNWVLKGHAREAFFRWLASWAIAMTKPSDLNYSNDGYDLAGLEIESIIVESNYVAPGYLIQLGLKGVQDRAAVRKGTISERVGATVQRMLAEPDEIWCVWAGLNDEADMLTAMLPGAVNVQGSDSPERKESILSAFGRGEVQYLVTKPRIAGFGMNFQRCARTAFVGLSDSFEQYYQCLRRFYRFGQTRTVKAAIVITDKEIDVYNNVLRKETNHEQLTVELATQLRKYSDDVLHNRGLTTDPYDAREAIVLPEWMMAS